MPGTRELAIMALYEIWQKGEKPKNIIEYLSESLDNRDRAFLMELVYGVLRYRDTLDTALKEFLKKPSRLSTSTLNNLRLGTYQILFMRVPEWAAVNEAVEMEKKKGRPELVNAVLRNILRNIDKIKSGWVRMREKRTIKYIAVLTSHPQWLIKRFVERFGEEEALELAEANNRIPPLTLRVNTLKSKREHIINRLFEMGIRGEPTAFSPDGIKLNGFRVYRELSLLKGYILVQDEASQLIAYLLDPQPGERILDACSAPGGKVTHIAQLMQDRGEIIAIDNDDSRLQRLKENILNFGLSSIKVVKADLTDYKTERAFDKILLDAPCSSVGVIRRNPDIKYRHTAKDLVRFKAKQLKLLHSVSRLLKPEGILVYSVCSTEAEEGEDVIKEFLSDSTDFYIIETAPRHLNKFIEKGVFRTYPHRDDMDGFFGVKLCKRA